VTLRHQQAVRHGPARRRTPRLVCTRRDRMRVRAMMLRVGARRLLSIVHLRGTVSAHSDQAHTHNTTQTRTAILETHRRA
jgi:hypothetical protein